MRLTEKEKLSLKERTEKKIKEIESYLDELISFKPENLEEYKKNLEKKWACERACERIAEGLVDLAIFIIRIKEITYNEEDEKSFAVLLKNNIINENLCGKMRNLKGMRDIIAHRYGEIDDELVFRAINGELEKDVNEFLEAVKKVLEEVK
ncbi:DUF86 domain-containing protein [Candidatus Pacearchaeota archaeon]|nr:DUF86 domain-containing protein [Candidatus Pacearchaeota archaeon]